MSSDGDIARYYDRNTSRFLLLGGGRGSHSIHRQLWGPGVVTVRAASDYINLLIADEITGFGLTEPLSVLDMGCGVGGTMFRLAETFPDSRFVGITISQRQRDIAVRLNARRRLGDRCRVVITGPWARMPHFDCRISPAYSRRSAIIGSMRVARRAGM